MMPGKMKTIPMDFFRGEQGKGEMAVLGETLLWSLFPVITVFTYASLSPFVSLAWSTVFATAFFAMCLTWRGKWKEVANRAVWLDIAWSALFIGVLHYGLVFLGLRYSTPGNVALVALTEILWSFLFFNVWKKERMTSGSLLGALLMAFGAAITIFRDFDGTFNRGDLLVFLAMAVGPAGNHFQRKAHVHVGSETIMFLRSLMTLPVLFLAAFLFHEGNSEGLHDAWGFLLVNGFFLLGLSKILWIEAIVRLPVVKALAISGISPLLTLFFSFVFLGQVPTAVQLLAFVPMFFGLILLTRPSRSATQ